MNDAVSPPRNSQEVAEGAVEDADEGGSSADDGDDSDDDGADAAAGAGGSEEAGELDAILDGLCAMFREKHGRDPTAAEVRIWVGQLREAAAEGGLDLPPA